MNIDDHQENWLLGLVGGPRVVYSPSPRMHQAALASCNLSGYYVTLDVEESDLPLLLNELAWGGYQGLNITNPHKTAVQPYLCGFSDEALAIGSVNTLIMTDNGYYGENTDAGGFKAAYLDDLENPEDKKALILGAGGASRAVIASLKRSSVQPLLTSRDPAKTTLLAKEFEIEALPWDKMGPAGPFDVVVNTTSVSSPSEFSPSLPNISLNDNALVIDINYGRVGNYFKDLAGQYRASFRDGLAMLAQQARLSFNHWTTKDPGLNPFLTALEGYIGEKKRAAN
ncbi:MAG: shikimate dehydrogenase [Deltaproteobacteria bacterium]|jgi:shikimate dehydrogenase|nr:shikimate dehydrogenase [Deltaproteobacteria bacterium]